MDKTTKLIKKISKIEERGIYTNKEIHEAIENLLDSEFNASGVAAIIRYDILDSYPVEELDDKLRSIVSDEQTKEFLSKSQLNEVLLIDYRIKNENEAKIVNINDAITTDDLFPNELFNNYKVIGIIQTERELREYLYKNKLERIKSDFGVD